MKGLGVAPFELPKELEQITDVEARVVCEQLRKYEPEIAISGNKLYCWDEWHRVFTEEKK